jgi:hypothetical protein
LRQLNFQAAVLLIDFLNSNSADNQFEFVLGFVAPTHVGRSQSDGEVAEPDGRFVVARSTFMIRPIK